MRIKSLDEALRTGGPRHLLVGVGYVGLLGCWDEVDKAKHYLNKLDGKFYASAKIYPDSSLLEKNMNDRSARGLRVVSTDMAHAVVETWQYRKSDEEAMALIAQFGQLFTFRFDSMLAALSTRLANIYLPQEFSEKHLDERFYGKWFHGADDPRRACLMEYGSDERKHMIDDFLLPGLASMRWEDRTKPFAMLRYSAITYDYSTEPQPVEANDRMQADIVFGLGVAPEFDTYPKDMISQQFTTARPLEDVEGDLYLLGLNLRALYLNDKRVQLIRNNYGIEKIVLILTERERMRSDEELTALQGKARELFGDRAVESCSYSPQVKMPDGIDAKKYREPVTCLPPTL